MSGELETQPTAGEIASVDIAPSSSGIVAQIDEIVAIDVVFAHGQGLKPVDEALRALADRRHDVE